METIFVQVENKKEAAFIKKLLEKLVPTNNIGTSKNKRLNKFIEDLEMEEDVKAYKQAKKKRQHFVPFEEAAHGFGN